MSYQLLSEGNLLKLHLVNAGLGGAKQRGCGDESALHDGQFLSETRLKDEVVNERNEVTGANRCDGVRCNFKDGKGRRRSG